MRRAIHFSDNDGDDDDDDAAAIEFPIKGATGAERQKNKAPPSLPLAAWAFSWRGGQCKRKSWLSNKLQ